MSKKLKLGLIIAASLFVALIVINRTGLYSLVRTQSAANEPTLGVGQHFFMSSMRTPKQFDLLCFTDYREVFQRSFMMVYRICGMPGDVVELRNARLFINGKLVDDQLNLQHIYKISNKDYFEKIKDKVPPPLNEPYATGTLDTVVVTIPDRAIAQNHCPAVIWNDLRPIGADTLFGPKAVNWTQNDFGPVTVPTDHYFVLGDNRQGADDSRFHGFIPKKKVNGVAVWIP